MTQVALLDSSRLSSLLKNALTWNENVGSLLVSAKNGSILAYAFRDATPTIKTLRTKSTTMTAAYTASADDTLIFEAQESGAISVITSIGDHLLLAVSSEERMKPQLGQTLYSGKGQSNAEEDGFEENGLNETEGDTPETAENTEDIREQLEAVSSELADVLKEELQALKWPEDI